MALTKKQLSEAMREMGKVGGKRRLVTMTPEKRRAIASAAGKASAKARKERGR